MMTRWWAAVAGVERRTYGFCRVVVTGRGHRCPGVAENQHFTISDSVLR
jgi:hypothetical protein